MDKRKLVSRLTSLDDISEGVIPACFKRGSMDSGFRRNDKTYSSTMNGNPAAHQARFFLKLFAILFSFIFSLLPFSYALFENPDKQKVVELEAQMQKLNEKIRTVTLDRDNLLKQAKAIQVEKDELGKKIEQINNASSGAALEVDSLKKETGVLKVELEKMKAAREKDAKLYQEEKGNLEKQLTDEKARADSVALMMKEYTPERIQGLIEDRNRLEEESKRMAQRVFEYEKRMEEMRKQMTPLELDREELHRVQAENREWRNKLGYVQTIEKRQKQLIAENAEYRNQIEILKAKFKDAAPGLAKSSRISQKMMRENADMHYNLANIFLNNKQYREAMREYERVLELRPSDPETHYNLGILYDDYLKDRDKALYHYQKYLTINPKAPDAKHVESYILNLELEQKVR